jgi:cysteine-rich repeat protein
MKRMLVAVGLVAMASCGDDPEPNGAPFVQALSFTTAEDTPLPINVVVSDPDRDVVTVTLSAPGHGTLTGSDRSYLYTPAPDFHGTDSVVATASDGALGATATLTITVTPVNDGPIAGADGFATAEDTALTTATATLLRNDSDPEGDVLTVIAVGAASHGTVAVVDSTVVFTPEPDFAGAAGYQYTVADSGGLSAVGVVAVAVGAGNDPPVAVDDTATTAEDVPLRIAVADLLGNDSDGDGQTLTITAVGAAVGGTVSQDGKTITFVPALDSHGTARFDYALSDGAASDTGTVVVTVTPVNDPPVAGADVATTAEDTAVTIAAGSLLVNDDDVDVDPLTVTAVGAATGGAVSLVDGQILFTPAADFSGAASFRYTVSDGAASVDGSVAVAVTPVNDPPVATDDAVTTAEDTPLDLAVADLVDNDVDVDGDALAVTAVGDAVGGTVSRTGDTIRFVPAPGTSGVASFSYTISDGTLGDEATVAVTVTAVNDAPVAVADSATTAEDTPLVLAAAALTANDLDIEGDPLTVTAVGAPSHGTVALVGATVTFTPEADHAGAASFTYTVSDGARSDEATVAVTVTPVNDAPVAVADTRTAVEDTPLVFAAAALVGNDTDADGDSLTVVAVSTGTGGAVELAGGTITFTPAADVHGAASFSYTVSDGTLSASAVVTVEVAPANDPPIASADAVTAVEDTPLVLAAGALTGNDSDVDGDPLTVTAVTPGTGGTVAVAAGVVTFTPAADATGAASFSYRVSDGTATDVAAVSVTITPVNDAPVAVADTRTTAEDTPLVLAAASLAGNDVDVDGDALAVTAVGTATGGTVALDAGTITFTPTADFHGAATFGYTVGDGALSAAGLVTVTVTPVNDPPVAGDDTVAGSEDTPLVFAAAILAGNDVDVDGDALTVTAVGAAVGGAVALAGGTITFTPAADRDVPGSFTYTVGDGTATDTGAVTVTLAAVNDAPVAVADAAAATEDVPLVIAAATLLDNDSDVDGDPLAVAAVADPTGGTVALAGALITFTPAADFNGAASFTYTASDGALTASATVAVTVAPVNDPPVAIARAASTMAELPVSITFMATDADSDTLEFEVITLPAHGALSGAGATRMYTPAVGFVGTDSFTYVARDVDATSAPATVTIEVHALLRCGDGDRGDGEACDDGNRVDGDGCSRGCAVEACGDGAVQLGLGEQCDDDNAADGDGCSAACQLEGGFATTEPVLVSGGLACELDSSNTGRKVAIDGVGTLYAVLRCDDAAHVVVSTDRGHTFTAPAPVGLAGIAEVAIAAGAGGVAYVAARVGDEVHVVRSEDAGQTWSAVEVVATSTDTELSIEAWADDVYVGIGKAGAVEVLRSDARGASWQRTTVAIAQVFFDLLLDDRTGDLLVCTDSPGFHVRRSRDQGATFAAEQNPAGTQSFSDWTAGNGQVVVAGAGTSAIRLGSDDLALAFPIPGLPQAASSQRAISADAEGNSYLVGRAIDGSIQLRRLRVEATVIDGDREVAPVGTYPGIASLPTSDGAAIVFAVGTEVYATVQVYD